MIIVLLILFTKVFPSSIKLLTLPPFKGDAGIDNLGSRMLIIGRSGLGKTNLLANMLLLPNWYANDFHADEEY